MCPPAWPMSQQPTSGPRSPHPRLRTRDSAAAEPLFAARSGLPPFYPASVGGSGVPSEVDDSAEDFAEDSVTDIQVMNVF